MGGRAAKYALLKAKKLLKPVASKTKKLAIALKNKSVEAAKHEKIAASAEKARMAANDAATKAQAQYEKVLDNIHALTAKCKEYAPEKKAMKVVIKRAMKVKPIKIARAMKVKK